MRTRLEAISSSLAGHYWTIRPFISQRYVASRLALPFRSARSVGSGLAAPRLWSGSVDDARWGSVQLTGHLHAPVGARALLLSMHGLGGSSESPYVLPSVAAAAAAGWACLRLNMRGADGSGEDFYHAALTDDLHAALASPMLAGYSDIYVLGYSLGGHLTLRLATEVHDPRVRAVAAVCAPLDLARSAWAIDRPVSAPYRHYVLRRLKECYAQVARRRPVPTPLDRVLGVRSLRRWDACTVVPRHGFASTGDYYESASVAGRLNALRVPALLVNTEHDPMVPAETVRPALLAGSSRLDVRWMPVGGHVGFPASVDLGERAPPGLESQIISWLSNASAGG
jgi:uncharacterized protein